MRRVSLAALTNSSKSEGAACAAPPLPQPLSRQRGEGRQGARFAAIAMYSVGYGQHRTRATKAPRPTGERDWADGRNGAEADG